MKYGQALYERSVPQWAPYNIDYNELKTLIRTHTTQPPGSSHSNASLPVVIPGQADEALSLFEARFARELGAQHARVDLFVRSKADEFRRRLTAQTISATSTASSKLNASASRRSLRNIANGPAPTPSRV
ncbi:hypothetical protein V491_09225 [Pseudogymnoascus sp. VKM F-3775]|nr:hypothetical protein V491_09225 [Pseudogymnoascus sp. VKM F-3775]